MTIKKICQQCGKEYEIPHWRKDTSKFCSRECCDASKIAPPNTTCAICGKEFHLKPYHIKRCKGDLGFCCSKECVSQLNKVRMRGENNHQFGLKGSRNASFIQGELKGKNHKLVDLMVYVGDWYKGYHENGRITKHRYLVELNHELFNSDAFEEKDGWFYLKKGYEVHHKDCNHDNNQIENLQVLTKGEHRSLHNKIRFIKRNTKGQFIK